MGDSDTDLTSEAYERVRLGTDISGRDYVLNRRTLAMIETAEATLGFEFDQIQGSFMKSDAAAASEHTHDGGGAADLGVTQRPHGTTVEDSVRALREVGFAAWFRPEPPWDIDHIHSIAIGDLSMHTSADAQVQDYLNGGDGLEGDGADPGPRVHPIPMFDYDEERDMQLKDPIPGTADKTVGDALRAALASERLISAMREGQTARQQALIQRQNELSRQLTEATQKIDQLPEGVTKAQVKELLKNMDQTLKLVVTDPDLDDDEDPLG